ncbi:MAG: ABC transporter ATP-binding protein [Thermoleophilia bacterium]|nr:ABC transporter ATP-binding protein [Thermoleophilia bacterium]
MPSGGASLVRLESVSRCYGPVSALAEVSLAVAQGEFLSIMGASGSGKTTLLNIIGCMDTATEGRVIIDGVETSILSRKELTRLRREKIGLIFQQFHLVPHLTSLENVMLAQYYHSLPDADEARLALERVGMRHRLDHLPRQLSGGEQQRVCIARALINYPALILADEPTGNLDEVNEKLVVDILQDLHKDGHTLVVVTHDPEIGALAERCVRLEHGRVAAIPNSASSRRSARQ